MAEAQTAIQAPREPSREALLNALQWLMSLPEPADPPAPTGRTQDR